MHLVLPPPLLNTRYENINHGLITALSERWHPETNKFHLPVGETIVTLDDVACLLDILIIGRLIAETNIEYEDGIHLLQTKLGFAEEEAQKEVTKQWGGYVRITHLQECYERLLNRCNQLEQPANDEEGEKQGLARTAKLFIWYG